MLMTKFAMLNRLKAIELRHSGICMKAYEKASRFQTDTYVNEQTTGEVAQWHAPDARWSFSVSMRTRGCTSVVCECSSIRYPARRSVALFLFIIRKGKKKRVWENKERRKVIHLSWVKKSSSVLLVVVFIFVVLAVTKNGNGTFSIRSQEQR